MRRGRSVHAQKEGTVRAHEALQASFHEKAFPARKEWQGMLPVPHGFDHTPDSVPAAAADARGSDGRTGTSAGPAPSRPGFRD